MNENTNLSSCAEQDPPLLHRGAPLTEANARAKRAPANMVPGFPRILLYSHDSWGLGHLRRSLTIASALTGAFPQANALMVTGSPCATHFALPERVDLVKLPAVTKNATGNYIPRSLSGELSRVLLLRQRILLETFRAFAPHLVIVDHQVLGLRGEMLNVLREARQRGARTIFGVRDVIDSPEVVAREWSSPECRWALTKAYDRICVYGDPDVFDTRIEYGLAPEIGQRVEFTGYIVRPLKAHSRRPFPSLRRRVLVTTGGGEDGAERIGAYLEAMALGPARWDTTIVSGPLLSPQEARQLKYRARAIGSIEVRRFHADLPSLLQESSAIVCMAGYNTTAEVLQSGRSAVLLPRTFPRREQSIRAQRLSRLGLARTAINPAPRELRDLVNAALATVPSREHLPDLDGCHRFCQVAERLLAGIPKALSRGA